MLSRVAIAANEATSINDALRICQDEVCNHTGWPLGHSYLVSENNLEYLTDTRTWHSKDHNKTDVFHHVIETMKLTPGFGLPGRVLRSKKPVWISDFRKEEYLSNTTMVREFGIKAGFVIPVMIKNNVVAVMEYFCMEVTEPDFELLEILVNIGTQIGRVIERVRAEESLASSEEKFATAFHSSPHAMCISSFDTGIVIDINDSLLKASGYSRHEIIGVSDIELDMWDNLKDREILMEELRKSGWVRGMDVTLCSASDEKYIFQLSAEIINIRGEKYILFNGKDITEQKRAEKELERYKHIVDTTNDFMIFIDKDYICHAMNQNFLDALQKSSDEVVGHSIDEVVNKEYFDSFIKPEIDLCLTGESFSVQRWIEYPGRGLCYINADYSPHVENDGTITGIVVTAHDVTELKQAEQALNRSNRALRVLNKCNHTIVHATTGQELINEICRIIVETGGYRFVWVGYAQSDENKTVYPVANAGYEAGYLNYDFSWKDDRKKFDPVSDVIRSAKPHIVKNLIDDQTYESLRNAALERAYRSEIALPLCVGEKAFGALMIYASEPNAFDKEEEKLLISLADDLAFGILSMHTRTKHERTELSLRDSENKYRLFYDEIPTMFFTIDELGTILSVNKFGAEKLGYKVDELLGTTFFDLSTGSYKHTSKECLQKSLEQPSQTLRKEQQKICKNGDTMWVKETIRVIETIDKSRTIFVVCEDITETHKLSEQLFYQASHDPLTGLINRNEFEERLRKSIISAQTEKSQHVLCYLDLIQFKTINDTCGREAGDELLRQFGRILQDQVRQRDTIARLDDDDFGILIEHCPIHRAEFVAKKLIQSVFDFKFIWNDKIFKINLDIGLASVDDSSGSVMEILKNAETACYIARDKGPNRVHIYVDQDRTYTQRQGEIKWLKEIREALEKDNFQLYFQAIVPLQNRDNEIERHEVLVRMKTEGKDFIAPELFLPTAENYNLSTQIDLWVISTLFNLIKDSERLSNKNFQYFINLSGHSLGNKEILEFITQSFSDPLIQPESICFEITETVAIANLTNAIRFINFLRQKGCHFALDDFGSGLSSFAYLKDLQVDYLKIDGMFIKDVSEKQADQAIVKSMHEVSVALGQQTIAESVENKATLDLLSRIGIHYAQGRYLGEEQSFEQIHADEVNNIVKFSKRN